MISIDKVISHIPTNDLRVTQEFFVTNFEFTTIVETDNYIELKNSSFTLGLLVAGKKINGQSIYFQVSNIESVWQNIKPNVSNYKHKELFTQDYGMKEFHVIIPETETLLMVGEPTNA